MLMTGYNAWLVSVWTSVSATSWHLRPISDGGNLVLSTVAERNYTDDNVKKHFIGGAVC